MGKFDCHLEMGQDGVKSVTIHDQQNNLISLYYRKIRLVSHFMKQYKQKSLCTHLYKGKYIYFKNKITQKIIPNQKSLILYLQLFKENQIVTQILDSQYIWAEDQLQSLQDTTQVSFNIPNSNTQRNLELKLNYTITRVKKQIGYKILKIRQYLSNYILLVYKDKIVQQHQILNQFYIKDQAFQFQVVIKLQSQSYNHIKAICQKIFKKQQTIIINIGKKKKYIFQRSIVQNKTFRQLLAFTIDTDCCQSILIYGYDYNQPISLEKKVNSLTNIIRDQLGLPIILNVKKDQRQSYYTKIPQQIEERKVLNDLLFQYNDKINKQMKQKITKILQNKNQKNKQLSLISLQLYTGNFSLVTNKYLREYGQVKHKTIETLNYIIIKFLKQLKEYEYVGQVIRSCKQYRFSDFFSQNDSFIWKSFTSTSKKLQITEKFSYQNGTIFYIKTVTGRYIREFSCIPQQDQVLIFPYTHFYVDKIEQHQNHDQVWLSELAAPLLYKKFILWETQKPSSDIMQICKNIPKQLEVLRINGFKLIQQWLNRFQWMIRDSNINFKIICDSNQQQKIKYKYLNILKLIKNRNYPLKTILYSNNTQILEKLQEEGLKLSLISITSSHSQLNDQCCK